MDKFKNRYIEFDCMSVLGEYIDYLLEDEFSPVLMINIQGVLFDYCDELNMIDPFLGDIIIKLLLICRDKVIFLTDRPQQYLNMTNRQLNNLFFKGSRITDFIFNIFSTANSNNYGDEDKPRFIKNMLEQNRQLLIDPKAILIYVSTSNIEFDQLKEVFNSFYTQFSLMKYSRVPIQSNSYLSVFLSSVGITSREKYRIVPFIEYTENYENEIKEEMEI